MKYQKIINSLFYIFSLPLVNPGCKRFVTIDPPKTSLVSNVVFENESTAIAAVTGIYSNMIGSSNKLSSGNQSISFFTGLYADELTDLSGDPQRIQFYQNALRPENNYLSAIWLELYFYVYSSNNIIGKLDNSDRIRPAVRQQLMGESKFIRAFCNFYLVNLFENAPLITTTDYKLNTSATGSSRVKLYDQIVSDLTDAEGLLSENYVAADAVSISAEKIRPNKSVARALLARVYLYIGDWQNAEKESTSVIKNSSLYALVPDLNSVFLKNSKEAIWQLQPQVPGYNTFDGYYFIILNNAIGSVFPVALSDTLHHSFESGDNRYNKWISSFQAGSQTYFYPFKYKKSPLSDQTLTEYLMVLRLGEQYLIRAEARVQQNNISESQEDLNIIRNRAGLPSTTSADKTSLLASIWHERQVELFTEWGQRWFDLKRTNRVNAVMGALKPNTWQPLDTIFPIPQSQILNDPNISQNAGY